MARRQSSRPTSGRLSSASDFDPAHTIFAQVVLHVRLKVIRMSLVVERILTLGGGEIIDPC